MEDTDVMKKLYSTLFIILLFLIAALPAQAQEPTGIESVDDFTFSPSSAYVGNTVAFTIDFTVEDVGESNSICLYYDDQDYYTAITDIASITSDVWGDTYAPSHGAGWGAAPGACEGVAGYLVSEWSVGNPHDFASSGDSITASFQVPSGADTETFFVRQYNPGPAPVSTTQNATLTILDTPDEIYVSNTSDCSGNNPCFTGGSALDDAIDTVAAGGVVYIVGTYSQNGGVSATLDGSKSITISGFNDPLIDNGGGTCTGAMLQHNGSSLLSVTNVTIDGSCGSGARAAGILNSGSGTTFIRNVTVRDFAGSGNAGVTVQSGRVEVQGSAFANNYTALDGAGGTLYAFANNVSTNTGSQAATGIGSGDNVTCNYWGSVPIDNSTQYAERLGSPVVAYEQGSGSLTLGSATVADNGGSQVLISLGRSTSNPPFNNGTVEGLGALASDFFAACGTRTTTDAGAISVTADAMTPGSDGFRLFSIEDPSQCSPSDNTDCWDYQGDSCTTASCSLTDPTANDGHFVVGNEMDPTSITLASLATAAPGANASMMALILAAGLLLSLGSVVALARRQS